MVDYIYDNTKSLKNSELMSLYNMCQSSSSVFMTNKTPTSAKKHCKSAEPELPNGQNVFLLSSFSRLV